MTLLNLFTLVALKGDKGLTEQQIILRIIFWCFKTITYKENDFITAPVTNMRTLKFNAQPTNAFFTTVNQMLGGSSQLPNTAERAVIKSLSTDQSTKQCSAVVNSREGN